METNDLLKLCFVWVAYTNSEPMDGNLAMVAACHHHVESAIRIMNDRWIEIVIERGEGHSCSGLLI